MRSGHTYGEQATGLWQKGTRNMLGAPLQSATELLGVLHVGRLTEIAFNPDDVALVELVAARICPAIQGRLLAIERAAGELVQRSLLAAPPPVADGLEFAAGQGPKELGGIRKADGELPTRAHHLTRRGSQFPPGTDGCDWRDRRLEGRIEGT